MLKFPRPGAVKTRLIPALGADRACDLYRNLVSHTLREADASAVESGVEIEIRLADSPSDSAAHAWLGEHRRIRPQGEGTLGERLERAAEDGLVEADALVVIGGDCPGLTSSHLQSAFAALDATPVVLGPARDGGYYLIGLTKKVPALFRGISWSTEHVLRQTQLAVEVAGLSFRLLEPLDDLDTPADLPSWAATPAAGALGARGVSVIIPTLNEEFQLPRTLDSIFLGRPHEVIVVDGGSFDATLAIARARQAVVLSAPNGRAAQMNAGAAVATGEFLLFLHADTLVPADYVAQISAMLNQPGVVGGAFGFALAAEFRGKRMIERGTNWRARQRQLPYGDQGIFLRRETFAQVGGFPDLPIMEDYELVRRLRRLGKIAIAPANVVTSGRRWQRLGALRTTVINQLVILGFRAGVSPARLARWYRGSARSPVRSIFTRAGNKAVDSPLSSSANLF